jgi:outer membrane protein OmpA-like peptidoglycan-associated protein
MKDPLAEIPRSIAELPIEQYSFDWESYYSLAPSLVLARADSVLKSPDSITLEFEGGVLVARGRAPESWCEQARLRAVLLPGIQSYDDSSVKPDFSYIAQKIRETWQAPDSVLINVDDGIITLSGSAPVKWIRQAKSRKLNIPDVDQIRWDSLTIKEEKQLEVLTHEIEAVVLLFNRGSAALNSGQRKVLMSLSKTIKQAADLARSLNKGLLVNVSGSADSSGAPSQNKVISLKRAGNAMSFLVESGVAEDILVVESLFQVPLKTEPGEKQTSLDKRLVKFSVQFKP